MIQSKKVVYVYSNSVHVYCPACDTGIGSYRELVLVNEGPMVVSCKNCSEQFTIMPSRRAYERHTVNVDCNGFCNRQGALKVTIADISLGGIAFVPKIRNLKVDDNLQLRFYLDSDVKDLVVIMVQVCHVEDKSVYSSVLMHEFTDPSSLNRIESYCQARSRQLPKSINNYHTCS